MSDEPEEYVAGDEEYEDVITMEFLSHWHISKRTFEFYQTQTKVVNGLPVSVGFPYEVDDGCVYKVRRLNEKKFFVTDGPTFRKAHLFGKERFPAGSKASLVITEGEKDALAAYEMLLGQAAVVSVSNGASAAFGDVKAERDYITSFPKIILALDNDKAGIDATKQIIRSGLFDYNKLFKVW